MARRNRRRGRRGDNRVRQRARRDVRASFAPELQSLQREGQQAEREAQQYSQRIGGMYEGLGQRLAPIGQLLTQQTGALQGGLTSSLEGLQGMLGGVPGGEMTEGTPSGEIEAGKGVFGSIGAGGLSMIGATGAGGAAYNASALRQAAIDGTNYRASIMEDLAQFQQAMRDQRHDITSQMGPLIMSRIDELRDRAQQLRMAKQELALRKTATMSGLGLDKARFGLERQRFGQEQQGREGLAAMIRRLLQQQLDRGNG